MTTMIVRPRPIGLPFVFTLSIVLVTSFACADQPLPGTQPLDLDGDLAARMVAGVDRFLLKQITQSVERRAAFWNRDTSSREAYEKSIEPNRQRLAHILGVRDERVKFDAPELVATTNRGAMVGRGDNYDIYAVRWPVLADPDPNRDNVVVHGEGLLLVPRGKDGASAEPIANIIAIPDADQTPEQICGLAEGITLESQFARRLAESGCRVIVPTLISRQMHRRTVPGRGPGASLTDREFLYRSAFELGRHLIGYEVQKVLACVDWFERESVPGNDASEVPNLKSPILNFQSANCAIGVIGYGEGGMLAMYAAALDRRIDACLVSGYFGPRETIWQQPLDRNVFGLLREFGDAELAAMIAGRFFAVDNAPPPPVTLPSEGGAPATNEPFPGDRVHDEYARIGSILTKLPGDRHDFGFYSAARRAAPLDIQLHELIGYLSNGRQLSPLGDPPKPLPNIVSAARQQRQIDELDQFNQLLLRESPFVRKEFLSKLDTSSLDAYAKSVDHYREIFRENVIGRFDVEPLPFNARSRKSYETDKWIGYEVVLDLWPVGDESDETVFAYGVLLLPKDLKTDGSERRPVVVCQHGLEGRPTDTFQGDHPAYHDFAAKLAERGFITFAPQNLYIGKDDFRTLQRKANPLGKTLFSIIVPQHQQIVDWLQSLPYVDPDRVGFYGLSYGGKTAMRVPPLVTDYCLSICSADFNEWVLKNASTRHPFSYVWTGEYEIFEFDLGSTFNYTEMAALIAPRPFMVERGHFDGVGWDEYVAHEFAKVRHLYQAKLGIGDRCEIEWFAGPHTIHGQGTYDFLHRHLKWPVSKTSEGR